MDTSSLIIDQTQLKVKISEVIENSVNIMEKGTKNIFVELNKMREEYSSLINKCKNIIIQFSTPVRKKASVLTSSMTTQDPPLWREKTQLYP
jgi:hypothetical protein